MTLRDRRNGGYIVSCETCTSTITYEPDEVAPAAAACANALVEFGWAFRDGRDLCPKCAESGPPTSTATGPDWSPPAGKLSGISEMKRRLDLPMKDQWRPWLIAAGIAVALGSLMPWATASTGFGSVSAAGTEGDGVFTLCAGGIAALLAGLRRRGQTLVLFAVAAGLGIYHVYDVSQRAETISNEFVRASVGWGLWLVVASSVAGVVITWISGDSGDQKGEQDTLPPPTNA